MKAARKRTSSASSRAPRCRGAQRPARSAPGQVEVAVHRELLSRDFVPLQRLRVAASTPSPRLRPKSSSPKLASELLAPCLQGSGSPVPKDRPGRGVASAASFRPRRFYGLDGLLRPTAPRRHRSARRIARPSTPAPVSRSNARGVHVPFRVSPGSRGRRRCRRRLPLLALFALVLPPQSLSLAPSRRTSRGLLCPSAEAGGERAEAHSAGLSRSSSPLRRTEVRR